MLPDILVILIFAGAALALFTYFYKKINPSEQNPNNTTPNKQKGWLKTLKSKIVLFKKEQKPQTNQKNLASTLNTAEKITRRQQQSDKTDGQNTRNSPKTWQKIVLEFKPSLQTLTLLSDLKELGLSHPSGFETKGLMKSPTDEATWGNALMLVFVQKEGEEDLEALEALEDLEGLENLTQNENGNTIANTSQAWFWIHPESRLSKEDFMQMMELINTIANRHPCNALDESLNPLSSESFLRIENALVLKDEEDKGERSNEDDESNRSDK